jgi:hypothetical protein
MGTRGQSPVGDYAIKPQGFDLAHPAHAACYERVLT